MSAPSLHRESTDSLIIILNSKCQFPVVFMHMYVHKSMCDRKVPVPFALYRER